MIHLFKHSMQHADMFIRGINLKTKHIEYQIVSKEGKAMEPIKKDKWNEHQGNIVFDVNRTLPLNYIEHIADLLNSK